MPFDFILFDLINGAAGRWAWLDNTGRGLAVYGLLAVFVAALWPLFAPGRDRATRLIYLRALLLTLLACAILAALETLATRFVLHREVRSRPMNARWVTLLITPETGMAFPAWPVVLSFALAVPMQRVWRPLGIVLYILAGLLAVSLVFVGVNFPFDVISGALLGLAIGATAAAGLLPTRRPFGIIHAVTLLWFLFMAFAVKPASAADIANVPAGTGALHVRVPAAARFLADHDTPQSARDITVEAASNGHLTVAVARVTVTDAESLTLPQVVAITRATANHLFLSWSRLDLLTITVAGRFRRGSGEKVGTLYTATLARQQMPPGGFPAGRPLPGNKFVHPLLLSHR
jgi:undecaprenyl-diphosphatase